jgi:hypothetical protein
MMQQAPENYKPYNAALAIKILAPICFRFYDQIIDHVYERVNLFLGFGGFVLSALNDASSLVGTIEGRLDLCAGPK